MQNQCAEIRIRAERRLGEVLAESPKAKGGVPYQKKPTGSLVEPVETLPTLADMGIDKKLSSRSQRLAKIPQRVLMSILSKPL